MHTEFVEIDPRVCNGQPVIAGTRIPITVVLDCLEAGLAVPDIVQRYPELRPEQVAGALRLGMMC